MKKLLFMFGVVALSLTSCNSDDDSSNSETGGGDSDTVLVKKTIETDSDGSTITSVATYDGTKIVKITASDTFIIEFTYTGDLITKMEYKIASTVYQTATYEYNNDDELVTYTRIDSFGGTGYKETYVHNSNGTISITAYNGDTASQNSIAGTGTITFSNGEVTSIMTNFSSSTNYTYDNKNNPFKNVTGMSKIAFIEGETTGILHNILTATDADGDDEDNLTYTYTYNDAGYPVTATESYNDDEDDDTTTTQFIYE